MAWYSLESCCICCCLVIRLQVVISRTFLCFLNREHNFRSNRFRPLGTEHAHLSISRPSAAAALLERRLSAREQQRDTSKKMHTWVKKCIAYIFGGAVSTVGQINEPVWHMLCPREVHWMGWTRSHSKGSLWRDSQTLYSSQAWLSSHTLNSTITS